jgi:hypothetical protein
MPNDCVEQLEFLRQLVFLTLCLAVDYTNKFDTCRSGGLTVALCLREEPAATT